MKKLTKEEFVQRSINIHKNVYDYSKVNYINTTTKVIIICPLHGEFYQAPRKHMQGQGCPICNKARRKTTEEFIIEAKHVHGDLYDYSKTKYGQNNKIPVEIICRKHGSFWQTPVHHVNNKCGCPLCNMSHGEELLMHYFNNNHINYIMQYEMKVPSNIRSTGIIKIDFYLPEYNTFVEYNGKQHYSIQYGFGGELKYKAQVIRDEYLRNYCNKKDIKLIEISYKEKDPINYLINKLYE